MGRLPGLFGYFFSWLPTPHLISPVYRALAGLDRAGHPAHSREPCSRMLVPDEHRSMGSGEQHRRAVRETRERVQQVCLICFLCRGYYPRLRPSKPLKVSMSPSLAEPAALADCHGHVHGCRPLESKADQWGGELSRDSELQAPGTALYKCQP